MLGFASLAAFMLVVIRKWATALVAVIVIPIVALLIIPYLVYTYRQERRQ